MLRSFPVATYHVFESLACTGAPWVQRGLEMLKNGQKQQNSSRTANIFYPFTSVSWELSTFSRKFILILSIGAWLLVSVIRSRKVSAIPKSLCTGNYWEWFGTTAFCPYCGGFCNTGSLFSEVPLYMRTYRPNRSSHVYSQAIASRSRVLHWPLAS